VSILDSKIPDGPIEKKWDKHKFDCKLVNPANKRKYTVIVVGTGLSGGAAAASLAEMGYDVLNFCIQDSPRRAHSIAAQGGINAAKNYPNDGDSVWRLFYDTVKGGDYRAREANVYRLAQVSNNIIDQCVAQGVPFAREYGGNLANRSFGGAQVSRTFYARGQTGQQLLLGAYGSLMRQIDAGKVKMMERREMLDLVVVDGKAKGIVVRNLVTGKLERHSAHAVVLATGGYANVFFLSTNAANCNVTASYRAYKRGAYFANPCYTQIHPTCIPVKGDLQSKLTLMSESLRNDGAYGFRRKQGRPEKPMRSPRRSAITTLSGATLRSAIWSRGMWPRARRKPPATAATGSVRRSSRCTSTFATRSGATVRKQSARSMETSSTCTITSPTRTRTRFRCAFTRRCTTLWAGFGWITISSRRSRDSSCSVRRTSRIMGRIGSARAR